MRNRRLQLGVLLCATTVVLTAFNPAARGAAKVAKKAGVLTSDSHVGCVTAQPTPQRVWMPLTGGAQVVLNVDGSAAGAKGCTLIGVQTGAKSATGTFAFRSGNAFRGGLPAAAPKTPTPILKVSVGDLFGESITGLQTIVTGMEIRMDPNLNFPDGTYTATVHTTAEAAAHSVQTITFVAKGGVLTIKPLKLPNGNAFPLIIAASTTSVISLFAKGVEPPQDFIDPPIVEPEVPIVPTTLLPEPTHEQPIRGAWGSPPPAGGVVGFLSFVGEGCGPRACEVTARPIQQNGPGSPAILDVPPGFSGSISYSINVAYMGVRTVNITGCPTSWMIGAATSGDGTIVVPASSPIGGPGWKGCLIGLSTLPKGKSGTYYQEEILVG